MIGKTWSRYPHSVNASKYSRTLSSLPGLTNRLVLEVIAANPNTIVVNQSGTPVEMPWINETHTVLQVRYHSP